MKITVPELSYRLIFGDFRETRETKESKETREKIKGT